MKAKTFRKYYFGARPEALPIARNDGRGKLRVGDWTAAGFNPHDEEIVESYLTEAWNGHRKGSPVLCGLIVTGHPFAVFSKPR